MMIGITGTPGTGKSAITNELKRRGYFVLDLKTTVKNYIYSYHEEDGTFDVDVDVWAENFPYTDGYMEGAIAHFLPCDKIIILRCRPDILKARLATRGYTLAKVRENLMAEALDVILIEAYDMYAPEQIYEIDTTYIDVTSIVDQIVGFSNNRLRASFGKLDWSKYAEQI